jgi:hypothetical protein
VRTTRLESRRSAWVQVLCALLLGACGSRQPTELAAGASAAPRVVVTLPAPSAPRTFEPAPSLVAPPLVQANESSRCRVSDHDLGEAKNVVAGGEVLYPVTLAFNHHGGLAIWATDQGVAVRALDPTGAPSSAVTLGPSWRRLPSLTALEDGFVLSTLTSKRLEWLEVAGDGIPRGERKALDLSAPTGLLQGVLRTGPREITLVGEPERPDLGPMPGVAVHVITVRLEGPSARADLRSLPVRDFFGDGEVFAGTHGGAPALLLVRSSGVLTIVKGEEVLAATLDDVSFDTRPRVEVWQMPNGDSSGFDYGLIVRPRHPPVSVEPFPEPYAARFTLSDPEWLGLPIFVWSGAHFVAGRLSGVAPNTRAKIFAVDCR